MSANQDSPSPAHPSAALAPIEPKLSINIRLASLRDEYDIKNIDALHKANIDGLGYWPLGRIKGAIEQKRVLIAETIPPCCPGGKPVEGIRGSMLGFLIYTDKYCKREDVGCIYAVCVHTIRQRGLIGAALVKNAFERMPYSVKLCCCWCAQDLEAGDFWQALGFIPLAYRTGSRNGRTGVPPVHESSTGGTPVPPNGKSPRIHIFWQKRIREGDVTSPWWYPSLTSGGAMNEGRLVLPMLPGMDWRDPKPMVLPEVPGVEMFKQLPGESVDDAQARCAAQDEKDAWKEEAARLREVMKLTPEQEIASARGDSWQLTAEQESAQEAYSVLQSKRRKSGGKKSTEKNAAAKKPAGKKEYSERYLEGARAICAMWLDRLHAAGASALPGANGKYDCSRSLESALAASGLPPSMLLPTNGQPAAALNVLPDLMGDAGRLDDDGDDGDGDALLDAA